MKTKDFSEVKTMDNMKTNELVNENEQAGLNKVQKIGLAMQKYAMIVSMCLLAVLFVGSMVFASSVNVDADQMWNSVMDTIFTWVRNLGAIVMFVGGIMAALGFYSDDAGQRLRGFYTIIAGGMVFGITVVVKQLML